MHHLGCRQCRQDDCVDIMIEVMDAVEAAIDQKLLKEEEVRLAAEEKARRQEAAARAAAALAKVAAKERPKRR